MIERHLGHYRILEKLGAGGMGVVYRARDELLQRDVALKLLPDDALSDAKARRRLLDEARSASSLNHPNICTVYEIGEADGRAYIAMEVVEGRPLPALIPADGLPYQTAISYGAQIADAVAHAHERGVLHRDLKTANLMVRSDGRVKVLDFGLAARLDQEQALQATRSHGSFAEQGIVVGTLHYMAPEILRGEPASPCTDIWAIGIILHEMVTGELPFSGMTGFDVSAGILRSPPASLPGDVPAGLCAVTQRCLAKDPASRYQTAAEVRAALETLLAQKAGASRARPSRRMLYKARTELRGKWKYLLTAALILFAGCFLAVILGTTVAGAPSGLGDRKSALILLPIFALFAAGATALVAFMATRWSFVIYPNKIRAKILWGTFDIPFERIENTELISYSKSWRSLFLSRVEFRIDTDLRFKKLGDAAFMSFTGLRRLIKVSCRDLGRRRGYYLDMDKADRFFATLNQALDQYRARQKSPMPVSPN